MKSPADKQIKKRQRKDKRLTFIVTLFGGMQTLFMQLKRNIQEKIILMLFMLVQLLTVRKILIIQKNNQKNF